MKMLRGMGIWIGGCLLVVAPAAMAQLSPACNSPVCDSSIGMPSSTPRTTTKGQSSPAAAPPTAVSDGPLDGRLEHDQARLRNADRQKQLEADTQKLVALANELKADVEKSNKDTLSLDVVRKADEIEKLAKSVRDKMKGT